MKESKLFKVVTYISSGITILLGFIYIFIKFIFPAYLEMPSESAASIGIIGGADGPTSIFLATKTGGLSLETAILIFGVVTAILFLLKRRIKNK